MRHGAIHRVHDRRRLCGIRGGRCALLLSAARGLRRDELAPWLCAGLIGYRALRMAGDARRARPLWLRRGGAHRRANRAPRRAGGVRVHPPGDKAAQAFARELVPCGRAAASGPPEELDAAILFAPVGALVPTALRDVGKGGSVVCAGIHMSDIPQFPYDILWGERRICSVANLTRRDGDEFIEHCRPSSDPDARGSLSACTTQTTHSTRCAKAGLRVPRCSCRGEAASHGVQRVRQGDRPS